MHIRRKEILIGYIVVPRCELKVKTHLRIITVNRLRYINTIHKYSDRKF